MIYNFVIGLALAFLFASESESLSLESAKFTLYGVSYRYRRLDAFNIES